MEDLLQIRTPWVNFYALRDSKGIYLIDAGFFGGVKALKRTLSDRGWASERIVGIIVTHGHLDHILNVATLASETGAWIAAPELDRLHYEGRATDSGSTGVVDFLESIGRRVGGYRPFDPDRWLKDGDELDVWHGLRAFHLPGHTAGHTGYYCEALKLLFCADLFASHGRWSHLPPHFFNSDSEKIPVSIAKACALDLTRVLPNHGDRASPEIHWERMMRIAEKRGVD